ncbi:MAG: hypothetical protein ABIS50_17750 [Luteolibacter sp.]|uniref:hypothetical protein n=1 Tax=Luteolibacter sp. TaxID=1962973 RepID=UPI0032663B68
MLKRVGLVCLVMLGLATVTWMLLGRMRHQMEAPNDQGAKSPELKSSGMDQVKPADSAGQVVQLPNAAVAARESSRHAGDELEKSRLPILEKAIATQELIVEEKRLALADVVRKTAVIYKKGESLPLPETPEEIAKQRKDGQSYIEAKRDFETDQKLLEEMKLKLADEKAGLGK